MKSFFIEWYAFSLQIVQLQNVNDGAERTVEQQAKMIATLQQNLAALTQTLEDTQANADSQLREAHVLLRQSQLDANSSLSKLQQESSYKTQKVIACSIQFNSEMDYLPKCVQSVYQTLSCKACSVSCGYNAANMHLISINFLPFAVPVV